MERYFTTVFEKALVSLGMKVSPPTQPATGAPALQLTMLSMNDNRFVIQAQLYANRSITFTKTYEIDGPPKPSGTSDGKPDINALRQRSYVMTNQTIKTVLADPKFKKAYKADIK